METAAILGLLQMKRSLTIAFWIAAAMSLAFAQDTIPYAYRPPRLDESYVPSLGDIMDAIQWRHLKLSYAGQLANWDLAKYELGQMEERLTDAARLYQNIPIEKIKMIDQPLMHLVEAVRAKNKSQFNRAFSDLTAACNSCHVVAQVGFIKIQIPTNLPFSNQSFKPNEK
jgi:hypothetical protein